MNGITRLLSVLGLALTVVMGSSIPASATFSDTTGLPTTSVSTLTVAAPTQVEAKAFCTTTTDPVTGAVTTTVKIKIEWWQSTSPSVSGYRVLAYPQSGSSYVLAETGPTDEIYETSDRTLLDQRPTFTVTTLTTYGWTAPSLHTEVPTC